MDYEKEDVCFSGAFAFYGSASPQFLVISETKLDSTNQADVGLIVHELLHNLGLGHTQKRQDAKDHIVINWKNIDEISHRQYKTCTKKDDPACKYYNTNRTPYDCKSIMHYGDMTFITDEAEKQGLKTMVAKDPSTCEISSYGHNQLSETDIDLYRCIANKQSCRCIKLQENAIHSPAAPASPSPKKTHVMVLARVMMLTRGMVVTLAKHPYITVHLYPIHQIQG